MATNNQLNAPFPLAVTQGGTGLASTTANQILYSSATSTIAGLTTANNGLLVTNGSGVPSIGNTISGALTVTGTLTATTGFATSAGAYGQFSTSISTSNAFTITKAISASSATTVLQITVPASVYFIGISCFFVNSRAPNSDVGTSLVERQYFSIGRNGSGSNVVLDNSAYAAQNFSIASTTAGGATSTTSGVVTIVRNGSESNTSPQVVNLTIDPETTGAITGDAVANFTIVMLGSLTGFSFT